MKEAKTSATLIPRRADHLLNKLLLGYFPLTGFFLALVLIPVVFISASGPAAMAGQVLLFFWSIQFCLLNLVIFFLKFTSKSDFLFKSIVVSILSATLIPTIFLFFIYWSQRVVGEPDLIAYSKKGNSAGCRVQEVFKNVIQVSKRARIVSASVQCEDQASLLVCSWSFEYQRGKGWIVPRPPQCK